jgi:hypothetical protein
MQRHLANWQARRASAPRPSQPFLAHLRATSPPPPPATARLMPNALDRFRQRIANPAAGSGTPTALDRFRQLASNPASTPRGPNLLERLRQLAATRSGSQRPTGPQATATPRGGPVTSILGHSRSNAFAGRGQTQGRGVQIMEYRPVVAGDRAAVADNPVVRFHRQLGTRWGAARGPFGLAGGTAPVARTILEGARVVTAGAGMVAPGALLALPFLERARAEFEAHDAFLAHQRGELYELPVGVAGVVKPTVAQVFRGQIERTYQRHIARYEKAGSYSPDEIGRLAEQATLREARTSIMPRLGMTPGSVWIGNYPVGVTGPRGGQITAEMASWRYNFVIELKKSPQAMRGWQAQAHEVAAENAVNFRRQPRYWRIFGQPPGSRKPR